MIHNIDIYWRRARIHVIPYDIVYRYETMINQHRRVMYDADNGKRRQRHIDTLCVYNLYTYIIVYTVYCNIHLWCILLYCSVEEQRKTMCTTIDFGDEEEKDIYPWLISLCTRVAYTRTSCKTCRHPYCNPCTPIADFITSSPAPLTSPSLFIYPPPPRTKLSTDTSM